MYLMYVKVLLLVHPDLAGGGQDMPPRQLEPRSVLVGFSITNGFPHSISYILTNICLLDFYMH